MSEETKSSDVWYVPLPPKGQRKHDPGNFFLKVLCCTVLPFRLVCYTSCMAVCLPLIFLLQCVRAPCRRCCKGKPSDILHKPVKPKLVPGGYAYQLVFDKPIDVGKLRKIVIELSAEFGIDKKHVYVEEQNDYTPKPVAATREIHSDYYTGKFWTTESGGDIGAKYIISLKVYNAPPDSGMSTVIMGQGDGIAWDGSSNFNFAKEYLNRYAGREPTKVNMGGQLNMTKEAKEVYDGISFTKFMCCQVGYLFFFLFSPPSPFLLLFREVSDDCRTFLTPFLLLFSTFSSSSSTIQLPCATVKNMHTWAWMFASCFPCCGGAGIDPANGRIATYNLNLEDSKAFAAGAKKMGAKPYSAMVWSIVDAHNQVISRPIRRVCMQASLQSRCYEPKVKRDMVGDWLVGPLQRIDGKYDLDKSHKEYLSLIDQLERPRRDSEVAKSLMGKAYGGFISGAATFEPWATYPYDSQLLHDTVFFNNYGVRTMPEELGKFY